MSALVPRNALARLTRLRSAFRVVIVNGPRQAGKTTLVRLLQQSAGGSFRTLDDEATLATALADPRVFVTYGETPRIIDEFQRGGMPWCWPSSTRSIGTMPAGSSSSPDRPGS